MNLFFMVVINILVIERKAYGLSIWFEVSIISRIR